MTGRFGDAELQKSAHSAKLQWLLKFVRAGDDPGGGGIFVRVECSADELQGEKERQAMKLESACGRAWICADAAEFKPGKRRR